MPSTSKSLALSFGIILVLVCFNVIFLKYEYYNTKNTIKGDVYGIVETKEKPYDLHDNNKQRTEDKKANDNTTLLQTDKVNNMDILLSSSSSSATNSKGEEGFDKSLSSNNNKNSNPTTTTGATSNNDQDSNHRENENQNKSVIEIATSNDDDDVCSAFYNMMSGTKSITDFWVTSLKSNKIQTALLAAKDNQDGKRNEELKVLAGKVLEKIHPGRLRRSVQNSASSSNEQRKKVAAILKKLQLRQQNNNYTTPGTTNITKDDGTTTRSNEQNKVRILVLGGSPTAGSNCYRNKRRKKNSGCAWPSHLEGFLNSLLGFDGFEIVNYAIGASDSTLGTAIMKHNLLPESMLKYGVDIVIYAYGVNDFSRFSSEHADMFYGLYSFLFGAKNLSPCDGPGPMVIFFDDVVFNYARDNTLHHISEFHSKMSTFAFWHESPLISYTNVVKDIWLNDTNENLFVDYRKDAVHAPRGGHVTMAVTIAYNLLHMGFEYCGDKSFMNMTTALSKSFYSEENYTTPGMLFDNKEDAMDADYLPSLHKHPSQLEISDSWRQNMIKASNDKKMKCMNHRQQQQESVYTSNNCAFAWVAMRQEREHQHLRDLPDNIMFGGNGGWQNRRTWPPSEYGLQTSVANATTYLFISGIIPVTSKMTTSSQESVTAVHIQAMEITYMKSYSEKWKNSLMKVDIRRSNNSNNSTDNIYMDNNSTDDTVLASATYSGFHEKETSEYYTESLPINGTHVGESLNVTFQMIDGYTFKIIALSFC